MRVHFIAIGGSAMHNLAIALHKNGFDVTGSDDEILEPSKSRLAKHGLLPDQTGWNPGLISTDINAVILGMHARNDNPELIRARELDIKIYSYPEYLYQQSKNKTRVVIGGSHGKTTITSIIMHVLQYHNIDFDFMVGAQLKGFDTMVKLSDAPMIILEGDEYLSSVIDWRPKFHLYKPYIALLSGIAWDHVNVFPTFENYVEQFQIFVDSIEAGGSIIYFDDDQHVKRIVGASNNEVTKISYATPEFTIEDGITKLLTGDGPVSLAIFGEHNLQNVNGARLVCEQLGVSSEQFYCAIGTFKGASKRLELLAANDQVRIYNDFAHSPSKLRATIKAAKEQFPCQLIVACVELHTFSSLNHNFLKEYAGTTDLADEVIVYFNPHTVEHKQLQPISMEEVKAAFANNQVIVCTDSNELKERLISMDWKGKVLLLMSSGAFDGIDLDSLASEITGISG